MRKEIGDVVLSLEHVSLAFGGVKALTDVSFEVREHEIRAVIGPNGAGKSSMLNIINGVYHPQQGTITFRGKQRHKMDSHQAAAQGTKLDEPIRSSANSQHLKVAFITDPWGSRIELTEGLSPAAH